MSLPLESAPVSSGNDRAPMLGSVRSRRDEPDNPLRRDGRLARASVLSGRLCRFCGVSERRVCRVDAFPSSLGRQIPTQQITPERVESPETGVDRGRVELMSRDARRRGRHRTFGMSTAVTGTGRDALRLVFRFPLARTGSTHRRANRTTEHRTGRSSFQSRRHFEREDGVRFVRCHRGKGAPVDGDVCVWTCGASGRQADARRRPRRCSRIRTCLPCRPFPRPCPSPGTDVESTAYRGRSVGPWRMTLYILRYRASSVERTTGFNATPTLAQVVLYQLSHVRACSGPSQEACVPRPSSASRSSAVNARFNPGPPGRAEAAPRPPPVWGGAVRTAA